VPPTVLSRSSGGIFRSYLPLLLGHIATTGRSIFFSSV
jgi:hypothetical protein